MDLITARPKGLRSRLAFLAATMAAVLLVVIATLFVADRERAHAATIAQLDAQLYAMSVRDAALHRAYVALGPAFDGFFKASQQFDQTNGDLGYELSEAARLGHAANSQMVSSLPVLAQAYQDTKEAQAIAAHIDVVTGDARKALYYVDTLHEATSSFATLLALAASVGSDGQNAGYKVGSAMHSAFNAFEADADALMDATKLADVEHAQARQVLLDRRNRLKNASFFRVLVSPTSTD